MISFRIQRGDIYVGAISISADECELLAENLRLDCGLALTNGDTKTANDLTLTMFNLEQARMIARDQRHEMAHPPFKKRWGKR